MVMHITMMITFTKAQILVLCHNKVPTHHVTPASVKSVHRSVKFQHRSVKSEHRSVKLQHRSVKSLHRLVKSVHRSVKSLHRLVKSVHRSVKSLHRLVKSVHRSVKSLHRLVKSVHRSVKSVHQWSPKLTTDARLSVRDAHVLKEITNMDTRWSRWHKCVCCTFPYQIMHIRLK